MLVLTMGSFYKGCYYMSVAHDGSKAKDGGNLSKQVRYKLRTSLFLFNCGVVQNQPLVCYLKFVRAWCNSFV